MRRAPTGPRHDWKPGDRAQLTVVTFSHAVQHFYPAALAIAYPFVVVAFHVSYGTLGVTLAIAGVIGGLLQGVAGLFERASARILLGLQNLGLGVATVLAAVAPGFLFFGIARCLGSLASWPQHPVGSAVLTRRFPERRAFALSWHVAGGSLGTAVMPLLASGLIAAFGWRIGIGLLAGPMAIGGLVVVLTLRETATAAVTQGAAVSGPGPGLEGAALGEMGVPALLAPGAGGLARDEPSTAAVPLRSLLRRRPVLAALAAGTIAAGGRGLGTLTTYIPAYLHSLNLSTIAVGEIFTAVVIGSILGPVAAGYLADRIGRRLVLVAVYLLGAGTIAAFALSGSAFFVLSGVGVLLGVFAYAESPLLQAVFSDAAEGSAQRAAFGLYFAISYGVGAVWLAVTGLIIDTWGFHVAFIVMASSFVVSAIIVASLGATPVLAEAD
ncbi:MAG: MFS transporter [Acidimicrobiales bacterium]